MLLAKSDARSAAFLLLVTLGFFWQGLADPVGMIHGDAAYFYQPYYEYSGTELLSGRFPHWNPFVGCGTPLFASLQTAALYPLRWLMLPFSFPIGYALMIYVHYFLAAWFTYLFTRKILRCSPIPSLIAAVCFGFGGFSVAHVEHFNYFLAYPWFVLTFYWLCRAMNERSPGRAMLAGVPIGLMALIGAVHLLLVLGVGLAFLAFFETVAVLARPERRPSRRFLLACWPTAALGIAVCLGGLLGAVQLVPGFAQAKNSMRENITWEQINTAVIPPAQMVQHLVVPFYHGNLHIGYWGPSYYTELCSYVGIVPLILGPVALLLRPKDRWTIFFSLLAVVVFCLAAGKYFPFYRFLYVHFPVFDRLKSPNRIFWWFNFAAAALTAITVQHLFFSTRNVLPKRVWIGSTVLALMVLAVFFGGVSHLRAAAEDPSPLIEAVRKQSPTRITSLKFRDARFGPKKIFHDGNPQTWVCMGLIVISAVAVPIAIVGGRRRGKIVGGALLALLVGDLGVVSGGSVQYLDRNPAVTEPPRLGKFLQENLGEKRYLVMDGSRYDLNEHRGMQFGLRHVGGGFGGITRTERQTTLYDAMHILDQGARQSVRGIHLPVADAMSVRYFIVPRGLLIPGTRPVANDGRSMIVENPTAKPLAYFVRKREILADMRAIHAAMRAPGFDSAEIAYVEEPLPKLPPWPADPAQQPRCRIDALRPGRIELHVETVIVAQLVFNESYNRQWACRIDGKRVPVTVANINMMLVDVPPGAREVVFQFEPALFRKGAWLSLLGVIVMLSSGLGLLVVRPRSNPVSESGS